MRIRERIKKVIIKFQLMNYFNDVRRKRTINQFDRETLKFKNINRIASKISKKYEEDVYDQLAERYIYRYMSQYSAEIAEITKKLKEEIRYVNQPFTVFTMWWQGIEDMPPLVKACVNSLKKISNRVVVITKYNYSDYIALPDYIISLATSGKMCLAHFSDIIRTFLLIKYGGVWIDSTVYIARKVPSYMIDDFFVFRQSPQLRECRSYANWWIASPPANDILIEELAYLYCYWKHHDVAIHYYIFHIFFRKIIDDNLGYKELISSLTTRMTDSAHYNFTRQYDDNLWAEIKEISPVFKCYRKANIDFSLDTFYSRLCKNQLD